MIQYFSDIIKYIYIFHDLNIFVLNISSYKKEHHITFPIFLYTNERKQSNKENRKKNKMMVFVYLIKRNPLRLVVAPLQPGYMFSQTALINDSRLKAKSKKTLLTVRQEKRFLQMCVRKSCSRRNDFFYSRRGPSNRNEM